MTDDRIRQEPLFSARYGYVAKALQFECVSEALFKAKNGDRSATLGAALKKAACTKV